MKCANLLAFVPCWLELLLNPHHPVGAAEASPTSGFVQPTGSISGQMGNAATQSYLEGAVVEVRGTDRAATTDREGRYLLNGVPTGQVTLMVSYAGMDTQRIPVSLGTGQRAVLNVQLTSEICKLDRFTVAGEREGTALAETLQRQAPNVKAIVSSDTFGNVADGNIGDMLQHMAGMTADYNGHDVRQVSIRGVGAGLNSVTMDGQQVASSQSAGTGRAFEFEQASLGNIETIEVTKAPTPDMDGASIGGSVNLVTKSPFNSSAGRVFRKDITDYIYTDSSQIIAAGSDNGFDGQYAGYGLTTQANGGSAKIEGIEFNDQQQLSFLPGWAKGFGVSANYTSLKTEGNYGGAAVLTTTSLAGFVNKSGNIGLNYRGYGFDLRALAVHRGEYLSSNSATPALVQYQKAKTTWEWKSRYAVSKRLSIFFDVQNVFSEALDRILALYPDRVINNRTFPAKYVAGITGRL